MFITSDTSAAQPAPGDASALAPLAGVAPLRRRLFAGSALFRQGDAAFGIFRLVSGKISLIRVTPEGRQAPTHTVRHGELFAEASLFSERYHCDAVALLDSEVLVYPKARLTCQLKENKEELWAFTADLARHVQSLRTRLTLMQIRSAPARVLQALQLRCDAKGTWEMDGTLKQFAEDIGLTHEALYRALATLERDGAIVRDKHRITLAPQKGTPDISSTTG